MTNIVKYEKPGGDNFAGWNEGVEGHDRPDGAGIIQGILLKFGNDAKWVTRDGDAIDPNLELVVVDLQRVVQRWEDGKPIETKILEPGEKFPDLAALNDAVPKEDWLEGPDGHPRGPFQAQHIVYLLDASQMQKYTFPTGTTGGSIAIRDLVEKLVWIRRLQGNNVFAVVTLGDVFMKTKFGGRQRPAFNIVRWARLGGDSNAPALPAPPMTPVAAVPLETVAEPAKAEADDFLNDPLPDFVAKKPAKTGKRANTLAAG
jgi:hypothetical protein